jgi:hypothetical protein
VAQVHLEVAHSRCDQERQSKSNDLDVCIEVTLADQLGADLEGLARPAAALRFLTVNPARVA